MKAYQEVGLNKQFYKDRSRIPCLSHRQNTDHMNHSERIMSVVMNSFPHKSREQGLNYQYTRNYKSVQKSFSQEQIFDKKYSEVLFPLFIQTNTIDESICGKKNIVINKDEIIHVEPKNYFVCNPLYLANCTF